MYYLLKASNELAKEQGACELFHETNYAKGLLPIDTYKKDVDDICDEELHLDWEQLRGDIKEMVQCDNLSVRYSYIHRQVIKLDRVSTNNLKFS